jgi:hypothetical protein
MTENDIYPINDIRKYHKIPYFCGLDCNETDV